MSSRLIHSIAAPLVALAAAVPARGQVAVHPEAVRPASWERIALRVVNQAGPPTVSVRLVVPEAIDVLGIESPEGWTFRLVTGGDSAAPAIEWTGDSLLAGQFREFAFLGRVASDVRNRSLVFPVTLSRADGTVLRWARTGEADALPPTVTIVGSTEVSPWATFAAAGVAMGVAILALGIAISNRRAPAA